MSPEAFDRLEGKVDKLVEAVNRLVLVEERQSNQGVRIGTLEQRVAACESANESTDRKVDKWVNRGVGVWSLAVIAFSILTTDWRWK